ncbi:MULTISPECIES: hypothetical protein [Pectobacterium]|uniref:hypothetical protein n=1 Tax=Pectobacterium TaxID=122277 RepID=UPI000CD17C06|nr:MULTISPECIES: hypothetical protein [Pectobacterium]MBB1525659.1 hypothetical protein [Pectobacterium carotovorum subsp. carotovorum]MCA6964739.1 hypothetical protein [Pectobacterium carotovorum]MCA6969216.1 hypothetical protein [Pectobacterium carotovorum]MCH4987169.1 hypothetical protein [Pectobacterium carotovorum]POE18468.1 hypothetical protein BV923_21350 [Pectobacterium odoriferum]
MEKNRLVFLGIDHALIKVSEHTSVYRGFSIIRCPRTATNPITRYRVSQGDQSFGLFDALGQATSYINGLHEMRGCIHA